MSRPRLNLTDEERKEHVRRQKREWQDANADKTKIRRKARPKEPQQAYRRANRDRANHLTREWRKTEKGQEYLKWCSFARRLRIHGLTLDQYHSLVEKQNFLCAICGIEPVETPRNPNGFVIDHDHNTGKVRGLLCGHCNVGIGMLKDSSAVCELAMKYLLERNK